MVQSGIQVHTSKNTVKLKIQVKYTIFQNLFKAMEAPEMLVYFSKLKVKLKSGLPLVFQKFLPDFYKYTFFGLFLVSNLF